MENKNNTLKAQSDAEYTQLVSLENNRVAEDEVDLFELLLNLWNSKGLIIVIAMAFTSLGGGYAYFSAPTYQADVRIGLTKESDLYSVNNSELVTLTPAASFELMRERLLSFENFSEFYHSNTSRFPGKNELLTEEQYAYQIFEAKFKSRLPKKTNEEVFLGFSYQYSLRGDGHVVLNDYLNWTQKSVRLEIAKGFELLRSDKIEANQKKLERLLLDYRGGVESKIARLKEVDFYKRKKLQDQLEVLRVSLLARNKQQILVLDENIAIARKLGFKNPTSPSDVKERLNEAASSVIKAEFSALDKLPLYFRGFESLEAEKNELQKRTVSNFPSGKIAELERQIALLNTNREIEKLRGRERPQLFLDNYLKIEQENMYLSSLEMNVDQASLFTLQKKAMPAVAPIKPKKLLILVLSCILGGVFAVLFVLVRTAVKSRQAIGG
jgi:LPS O-antigen subunit length determinant protein (WzzB/FepE family)